MNLQYDKRCKEQYWLVSTCGLTPWEASQLTYHEVKQLQRGQELINEDKQRAADRGRTPSPDQRRREQEALKSYA